MEIVTVTEKDANCWDEMWDLWFRCPKCGSLCITDGDNYCSNCGVELKFTDKALKISGV